MSTTKRGIYYQNDYNQIADVLEDSKKMAESIDEIFDDEEIKYDKKMSLLQQENEQLKSQIPIGKSAGEEITLNDSSNLPFKELKIVGNSFQETREGYNKVLIANKSQTFFGVELTINEDGTFNLKGTVTTNSAFTIELSKVDFMQFLDKAMTLSCGYVVQNNIGAITVNAYSTNENKLLKANMFNIDTGHSYTTKTINSSDYDITGGITLTINIYIPENLQGTEINISGYLQLVEGTENKPYEQYGAMPSPEFSSEIKNCGDNINLFDEKWTGTVSTNFIPVVQGKEYIYSEQGLGTTVFYDFYESTEGERVSANAVNPSKTFIPEKNGYIKLRKSTTTKMECKLEKGSKITPYSPYNCGNVNFKVCNKNLSPELVTGYINTSTGILNTSYHNYKSTKGFIPLKANTQMKIIRYDENTGIRIYYYETDGTFITSSVFSSVKVWETTIYDRDVLIKYMLLNTTDDEDIKTMVCDVNLNDDYIPHEEQLISFPTKEGQVFHKRDYLADDGVHRKRKTIELTGNENWVAGSSKICYWFKFYDDSKKLAEGGIDILCNRWKKKTAINNEKGVFLNNNSFNGTTKYLVIYTIDELTTLEEFTSYLKQQKANGTPVIIEYELEEEIIEPYNEEQQKAYNKIKALAGYKNVTHIFSEDKIKPSFEVTYYKDLETLLNNKTASVSNEVQQEVHSEMTNEEPSIEDSVGGEE